MIRDFDFRNPPSDWPISVFQHPDFVPLHHYFPPELEGIPCGFPQPQPGEVGRFRGHVVRR